MNLEQLFLSHLELIESVIAFICRRHHLRHADAEDFASTVKLRFVEHDYEILARFQKRSTLRTYLTTVIHRLFLDYAASRWGKWRPSAEARRLGPVALRLEALLYRDKLSFDDACNVLATEPGCNRDALEALRGRLPRRETRQPGAPAGAAVVPEGLAALERADRQGAARRTGAVLRRALDRIPPRDRIVLRLHFQDGLSVAEVARSLGEDQKGLYRRIDRLLKLLQADLAAEGIGREEARELLSEPDWEMSLELAG